jgi:hypothetical protein
MRKLERTVKDSGGNVQGLCDEHFGCGSYPGASQECYVCVLLAESNALREVFKHAKVYMRTQDIEDRETFSVQAVLDIRQNLIEALAAAEKLGAQ